MSRGKAVVLLLTWIGLALGVAATTSAGEQKTALLKQYWGQVSAVKINKCGKRPGLCEGVIILTSRAGEPVSLAIRPGTWIKRGDHLVLLEDLSVGNDVHVQAMEIVAEGVLRAITVEIPTKP
jgi:hypothetical protein